MINMSYAMKILPSSNSHECLGEHKQNFVALLVTMVTSQLIKNAFRDNDITPIGQLMSFALTLSKDKPI